MSALSENQIHILRHSLGLTYGDNIYRDHFVTGEGSLDFDDCLMLVGAGLMKRYPANPLTGGMDTFIVTEAGKAVALEHQPKLTRAQRRYRDWLNVADMSNMTFGEYLKRGAA